MTLCSIPDSPRIVSSTFAISRRRKGEEPALWPNEFFYQNVWTKSLAERRTMAIGTERVARARLSKDNKSLEDVEVLVEGAERRIVLARDGTLLVTGADRFRLLRLEIRRRRTRFHR